METEEKCDCELCELSKQFETLAKKATESELKALNEVWDRMEAAETKIEWDKAGGIASIEVFEKETEK